MRNKLEIEKSYSKFNKKLEEKKIMAYQLSKDLGIASSTITAWKKNEYEPNGRTMYKIAKYLEVPISYFYD